MHIHLVGVCGTGMGSLAGLLKQLGHRVSGSDSVFNAPMAPKLVEWGVECKSGFDAAHLEQKPDLVVIGNVCRQDNVEARAAVELGLETTHIAGALQRFALRESLPLVVAGTHGKTTTSSLCAWLLEACGRSPGFFIGGLPANFGKGFQPAQPGGPFVVEGDEYDTAYFEKTAKFLHYQARHAILTSIEHDHIDIYPTADSYLNAFAAFLATLSAPNSVLVANARDANTVKLLTQSNLCNTFSPLLEWYSAQPCAHAVWTAGNVTQGSGAQHFDLLRHGDLVQRFELPLSGQHNLENALAAIVACHSAFGCKLDELQTALASFKGSKRRQELLGKPQGIRIYDDFAHHPTAVRKTLAGLRARHPEGKLIAVFEPRSATACRKLHQAAYPAAFADADEVLLAPVGRSELKANEKLDTESIAAELRRSGTASQAFAALSPIIPRLLASAQSGDTVVLLSNGAFGGIPAKLLAALSLEQPTAMPLQLSG